MQIPIDISVLKSVLSIDDEAAQQKIDQIDRVRINEDKVVELKRQKDGITVEVPNNLGGGLLGIELVDKYGGTITTLAYDLKTKEFRRPRKHEEEKKKTTE
jgi:hypothetical protein